MHIGSFISYIFKAQSSILVIFGCLFLSVLDRPFSMFPQQHSRGLPVSGIVILGVEKDVHFGHGEMQSLRNKKKCLRSSFIEKKLNSLYFHGTLI